MDPLEKIQRIVQTRDGSWSYYTKLLEDHIREAIEAGYTYRQVAAAAGVGHYTIQRIMKDGGQGSESA